MYKPLPDGITIKKSPINGLGLFATEGTGLIAYNFETEALEIFDEEFDVLEDNVYTQPNIPYCFITLLFTIPKLLTK